MAARHYAAATRAAAVANVALIQTTGKASHEPDYREPLPPCACKTPQQRIAPRARPPFFGVPWGRGRPRITELTRAWLPGTHSRPGRYAQPPPYWPTGRNDSKHVILPIHGLAREPSRNRCAERHSSHVAARGSTQRKTANNAHPSWMGSALHWPDAAPLPSLGPASHSKCAQRNEHDSHTQTRGDTGQGMSPAAAHCTVGTQYSVQQPHSMHAVEAAHSATCVANVHVTYTLARPAPTPCWPACRRTPHTGVSGPPYPRQVSRWAPSRLRRIAVAYCK